jgi:hypothetical protein
MRIYSLLLAITLFLAVSLLPGCAPETGWRFEIGVSPVKELNNNAGLKQAPPEKARY